MWIYLIAFTDATDLNVDMCAEHFAQYRIVWNNSAVIEANRLSVIYLRELLVRVVSLPVYRITVIHNDGLVRKPKREGF